MFKKVMFSLSMLLTLLIVFCAATTYCVLKAKWIEVCFCGIGDILIIYNFYRLYRRNARKVAFMFDAIENDDYTFRFPSRYSLSTNDQLVSKSLNRVKELLMRTKAEAIEKEKYYELIMNSVTTGIITINDKGSIYQTNNEALRLLGLSVFTHISQLKRIDESLPELLGNSMPGNRLQTSFVNERGTVHLSIRVSSITLRNNRLRLIAINDINNELDEKEIDSWIRLIRVLTHEIMNSITPITSISDTLLNLHQNAEPEIRNGLDVISTTGKGLIAFVDSYRKFTRIPTPQPDLFYVEKFVNRMVELARPHSHTPNIAIQVKITPPDLLVYADENLISQVFLNLLKNAMQAIGNTPTGLIQVKGYSNADEEVLIEISNNGPAIPADVAEHIFIPFFTTKESGSGIGLSVSRQIMRLSGGSITLKSAPAAQLTTFVLTFK